MRKWVNLYLVLIHMSKNSIVTNSNLLPVIQFSNFFTSPSCCTLSQSLFYNERKVRRSQRVKFLTSKSLQQLEFPEATLLGGGILWPRFPAAPPAICKIKLNGPSLLKSCHQCTKGNIWVYQSGMMAFPFYQHTQIIRRLSLWMANVHFHKEEVKCSDWHPHRRGWDCTRCCPWKMIKSRADRKLMAFLLHFYGGRGVRNGHGKSSTKCWRADGGGRGKWL